MNDAPCSWRVMMPRIFFESSSATIIPAAFSPAPPNAASTSTLSSPFTIASYTLTAVDLPSRRSHSRPQAPQHVGAFVDPADPADRVGQARRRTPDERVARQQAVEVDVDRAVAHGDAVLAVEHDASLLHRPHELLGHQAVSHGCGVDAVEREQAAALAAGLVGDAKPRVGDGVPRGP